MSSRHLIAQRAVAVLFIAAILFSVYGARTSVVAAALERGQRVPVLLFGIDAADQSRHTDTIMITVFDPAHAMMTFLSMPRDTRVDLPGYLFRRVNEIYGYHYRKTGDPMLSSLKVMEGIEYLLSSENVSAKIPYFIQVDFSGFARMVDLVGGVWVNVKQPMHYDDNAGNLHIHFEPGRYLLKGSEALRYVRFRGQTGDRGRIMRQQEFLRNMVKRLANPVMILKFPQLVGAVASSIRTNLSFWDVVYLSASARRLRANGLGFYILPGRPRGPYWVLNRPSVDKVVQKIVLGLDVALDSAEIISPQMERITINVWNASGQKGLAYKVTQSLREAGYDVVDWGNYAMEQLQTRVFDRTGELSNARDVANTLGVDDFHSEINSKALVDVEVVLGQNYRGFVEEK